MRRLLILAMLLLPLGCKSSATVLDVDKPAHLTSKFDYADLKSTTEKMVQSLISNPPLGKRADRPVIVVYGLENRTSEHLDTKALTEKVQTALTQSGKVRFVNIGQRKSIESEVKYQQGGMVAPETRIALGKQTGAEYMLTGAVTTMQQEEGRGIRLYEKSIRYYKINLELTDLNTNIIEWSEEKEFAREMEKPFIGW